MSFNIHKAFRLVRTLRTVDSDMSLMVAETFLLICQDEGIGVKDLSERVGVTVAGSSRHVSHLSRQGRNGKPGLDLIELRERVDDRRYKGCYLTKKGKLLRDSLLGVIQ